MCFSATASFAASAGLVIIGGATLKQIKAKKEIPLASIPILFAIQQFIEGMIWVGLGSGKGITFLTNAYAVFSHVLWPFFIPLAVYLIEPDKYRKKLISGFLLLGVFLSSYILYFIIKNPIQAAASSGHISYTYLGDYPVATLALYLLVVSLAPLFSSYRMVKVFGVALFLSAYLAYEIYVEGFFSVWCYFAALLSALIFIFFKYARMSRVKEVFMIAKRTAKRKTGKIRRKINR